MLSHSRFPTLSRPSSPFATYVEEERRRERRKERIAKIVGLGAIVLLVVVTVLILIPTTLTAMVDSTYWRYTIHLRQKTYAEHEDWRGDVPTGATEATDPAFGITCKSKERGGHFESCMCTSSTDSNGFTSQSCMQCYVTDYDDWCHYSVYEWPIQDTRVTDGHDDHKVFWPEKFILRGDDQRMNYREAYQVVFRVLPDKGRLLTYKPDSLGEFEHYDKQDAWVVKANAAGSVWPQKRR